MNLSELLPQNAQSYEKALAFAATDTLPVPLAEILDPDTCPVEWLPFLAAHESVDLWYEDWPVERKRQMIRDSLMLSSIRGTRAAAEPYLAYVDAELVDRISHPTRFVIGWTPIRDQMRVHHPHHTAHFLVKTSPIVAPDHFIIGRSPVDQPITVRDVDTTPLTRARTALAKSKSPETFYSVDFGWQRPITFDEASFGGRFDIYTNRTRL
ncbi:phage tail protein I [Pararhizobium haloflavum]|uniref:phage tail protein I n=1 Tax=Pararhizobium haloflavum TaxID=2037914 RepID=UPI000C18C21D|nr:phage tail protein I [Pararhizobium haloflavum]